MPAAALSATIVTFRPDIGLLRHALSSLAGAIGYARAAGRLSSATIYVVDNGPEDARGAIEEALAQWPAEAGALELVAGHGNVGYGRANNLVLERLDSDYHLVMNPDVELEPESLDAVLRALLGDAGLGMAAPAVYGDDGQRQYLCKRYPSLWVLFLRGFAPRRVRERFASTLDAYEMRDVIAESPLAGIPLASGCFMLMRTEIFKRLKGFDPRFFLYFEDYDLSLRIGRESSVGYVPQSRIIHHGGEAATKGWRHVAWFVRSAWRFFSTHGWKIA